MTQLILTQEEQIILQLVLDSKQMGITTANIVKKAQINDKQVQKLLSRLELYEQVKSIRPNGKLKGVKYWIGFNQEMESSLPNNPFRLPDQSINQQLIDKIKQKIIQYLQQSQNQQAPLKELQLVYKTVSGQAEFKESDFHRILDLMLYDQIIEHIIDSTIYQLNPMKTNPFEFFFAYLPCQTCPVQKQCSPGNIISPENCVYQW